MKTLYLNLNEDPIKIHFEKVLNFKKIKINKLILLLNYKNFNEKAYIKTGSSRQDFEIGYYSLEEIQKEF